RHYHYWQATGQEMPGMVSSIRNGVLVAAGVAVAAFVASFVWIKHAPVESSRAAASSTSASPVLPAAATHGNNGAPALLSQTGEKFVLEVRGLGLVTGRNANDEIWNAIEAKADNHSTYMSQSPADYPDSEDSRMTYLGVGTGLSFQLAAHHSVGYWPVPVFIWEPPKASHVSRPANELSGIRQEASLGVTLLLWQEDANTNDGSTIIEKLFAFFDAHPDIPEAIIVTFDGAATRDLNQTPGYVDTFKQSNIPTMPDSMVALLVSRSDRVDRLIRPYAVEQTENVDKNTTEYDITKLWNFFWEKNNGEGPGSFEAYYQEQQKAAGIQPRAFLGFMSAQWWQTQLPDFWKTISNKGPGEFKPTPYIPVRWTTWQVKQFDNAPLLGYLHRPIDVKLADAHGKPLKTAQQAQALKAGWQQAVDTLPTGETPKRIFYDTTGDRAWVAPINQALAQSGPSAPSLDDVKEGYDIGRRIGNTGISSPLVQIGLGLIASYHEGGASATIHRRPNGTATIVMVSPPTHKQPDVNPFR
ncbi:type VI lipase adapter Tla3 domain-containing protein, partial [Burkholderia pseudomallei]